MAEEEQAKYAKIFKSIEFKLVLFIFGFLLGIAFTYIYTYMTYGILIK